MPEQDPAERLSAALEGRYRIERELGQGGMATVYLADDLRHDRKVALKVLKPELAAVVGADRFLAEIKTTASLQHPHILPLFDSGEADSFLFYVMPYVEGESLRERLDREHQLPVDEAVGIASRVAGALQAAHDRGVIHRDIKPANILLSKGEPLVSDFGIALAVGAAGGGRLTETGLSLGTPHYMSPEQATGDVNVGAASDLYSLGGVLYEMLVGEPPFTASTPQGVLGKIITEPPPPTSQHRKAVPPNVEAAIARALEKVPADRFGSAADFVRALRDAGFAHRLSTEIPRGAPSLASTNRLSLALAGTTVALVVALGWTLVTDRSSEAITVFSSVLLPAGESLALADYAPSAAGRPSVALSPDGTRLVFVAVREDVSRLFVQDLTRDDPARELPGTEGAFGPFFSPDGAWVGFFTETELRRISVSGGAPQTLTSATYAVGADWPRSDAIVYADAEGKRLQRLSTETGEVEASVTVTEGLAWWPEVLPDGNTVLVTNSTAGPFPGITAISLDTGERTLVISRGSAPEYVARTGHLLYAGESGIMAVPFDPRTASVGGAAALVLEDVRLEAYGRVAQLSVSENGVVAFVRGEDMGVSSPVWVDRRGAAESLPLPPARYGPLRLSPDGSVLALSVTGARADIRLYDFEPGFDLTPLTNMSEEYRQPIWSADGEKIAFVADVGGDASSRQATLFVHDLASGTSLQPLEEPLPGTGYPQAWSPNGDLVLSVQTAGGETDMWILRSGASEATPWLELPGDQWAGDFSPDGRWLAYHSDESGMQEVYVADYPDGRTRRLISVHPGEGKEPIWSPLGDEIFYRSDGSLYAVSVTAGDTLAAGTPERLFRGPYVTVGGPEFDVAPDAQRFLMLREPLQPDAVSVGLITGFFERLERLAPAN